MARPTWKDDVDWQKSALCHDTDVNLFFAPNTQERRDEREARERKAKAICGACPVREHCLNFALGTREPHGVWGGLNEIERRHILIRRERRAV